MRRAACDRSEVRGTREHANTHANAQETRMQTRSCANAIMRNARVAHSPFFNEGGELTTGAPLLTQPLGSSDRMRNKLNSSGGAPAASARASSADTPAAAAPAAAVSRARAALTESRPELVFNACLRFDGGISCTSFSPQIPEQHVRQRGSDEREHCRSSIRRAGASLEARSRVHGIGNAASQSGDREARGGRGMLREDRSNARSSSHLPAVASTARRPWPQRRPAALPQCDLWPRKRADLVGELARAGALCTPIKAPPLYRGPPTRAGWERGVR